MDKTNKIISGVIWKQILIFFFPIVIGAFFQQLYNTIDAVIVGKFIGKIALSAVGGSSSRIIFLLIGFFIGISTGATSIIARYYGAKDYKKLKISLHTAVALSFISGIIIMILGLLLSKKMLIAMKTPDEVMDDSIIYLKVCFSGMAPSMIYNMGAGILRALGDSKRPLYLLIVSSLVNIVLDIVFVIVFNMGVVGVGLATVIAQAVSAIILIKMLIQLDGTYALKLKNIKIHFEYMKSILKIGIPVGLQSVMFTGANIIIQTSVNLFGTETMAAFAAYIKIDQIVYLILNSFGIALMTFVGQNYGAYKFERITKAIKQTMIMSFISLVIVAVIYNLFGKMMLSWFTNDKEVIEIGYSVLRVIATTYSLFIVHQLLTSSLSGIGNSFIPMILTAIFICGVRVVWIFTILPYKNNIITLVTCYPISWILGSLSVLIYFIIYWKKLMKKVNKYVMKSI